MRLLLLSTCLCILPIVGKAGEGISPRKSVLRTSYQIKSDQAALDVPLNKCRVKGKVHSAQSVKGGTISTLDRERICYTDTAGTYEFMVRTTDTSIFFYKPGLDEIVIWSYEFKGGHEVIIDFFPQNNWEMIECDKPVIYMYSDQPLTATLEFNFYGDLSFTYPRYDQGWTMEVSESGTLRDSKSNKEYPYLFWEGEKADLNYQLKEETVEGFFIDTDTTISFLENTLSSMGLSQREQTDFITFWGPQIEQDSYACVQFLIDEDYESTISKNLVQPAPDVSKRVYMLFTSMSEPMDLPFSIQEPSFESIERKGFVLIEWGGSEIPLDRLISI